MKDKIALQGTDEDEIFKGLNNYFRKLAANQIKIAFEQAQKEVDDLHQRTREGIETARLSFGVHTVDIGVALEEILDYLENHCDFDPDTYLDDDKKDDNPLFSF